MGYRKEFAKRLFIVYEPAHLADCRWTVRGIGLTSESKSVDSTVLLNYTGITAVWLLKYLRNALFLS